MLSHSQERADSGNFKWKIWTFLWVGKKKYYISMRLHSNKYFVFLKNIRVFTCKGTAFAKILCILAQNICVLMWKYWFPPITFSALSQNICVLLQKYCIPPRNLGVHMQESFSSHLILYSSQKFCKTSFSGGHKGFLRDCKSINVHCSVWIRMSKGLINTLMQWDKKHLRYLCSATLCKH